MAAALSRALKLPGKKIHDLGEYDPLRQADSDDSEDDSDLSFQKNGNVQTEGSDEAVCDRDADAAVEMHTLKTKQRRTDEPSSAEVRATEVSDEFTVKARISLVPCLRTAAFLLTLAFTMVLVLVCAFFIPCPRSQPQMTSWNRSLGQAASFPPVMTLWDVNDDQVSDVIISFGSTGKVRDQKGGLRPQAALKLHVSVAVLSGVDGNVLWTALAPEQLKFIQCGIGYLGGPGSVCLLIGISHILKAVNSSSGSSLWEVKSMYQSHQTPAAPAVLLPDIDGDGFADLLLGSRPTALTSRLREISFVFVSGATGALIGRSVSYNVTGEGKLIGPKACMSGGGTLYVLFGYGTIQAVAVRDIYTQANGKGSLPPSLQGQDTLWEWKRNGNLSGLLEVYSNDSVRDVQTLSRRGGSDSDTLITTKSRLQRLSRQHLLQLWSANGSIIDSSPVTGFFNQDNVLDFLIQITSRSDVRESLIIDGSSGEELWKANMDCRIQEAASIPMSNGRSAFLFWAEECGVAHLAPTTDPDTLSQYHLYLLHPLYPSVLLELANSTAVVTASATGLLEQQKDAFYVTVTMDTTHWPHESGTGHLMVTGLGLNWAISHSRMVALEDRAIGAIQKFVSKIQFSAAQHSQSLQRPT
ncbi:protein FAM234B isoform X2 [Stegostoma tigrinum]|uniref:protein FAM234B isoform X2 n=1 Tax=Stegostoma tigrinum TaxID=3053191 RepID=UPI00202AC793|nr:protein FAM234B isoform X2 [Stegostoma tigrinum]